MDKGALAQLKVLGEEDRTSRATLDLSPPWLQLVQFQQIPHCTHSLGVLLLGGEIPSSALLFPCPLCHPQHQPIPPSSSSGVHRVLHWAELVCSFNRSCSGTDLGLLLVY